MEEHDINFETEKENALVEKITNLLLLECTVMEQNRIIALVLQRILNNRTDDLKKTEQLKQGINDSIDQLKSFIGQFYNGTPFE